MKKNEKGKGEEMKKYMWFFIGYITALGSIFMASCTYAPLEANDSDCGTSWNPCHVRIVD